LQEKGIRRGVAETAGEKCVLKRVKRRRSIFSGPAGISPLPRRIDLCSRSLYSMADMDKIFLEMLPVTSEGDRAKRWEEEKGEFAQICFGEEARHIALFTLRKGFWRGMHYHEKKEEIFYVVVGKVRAVFIDMDTDERVEHLLTKGARLRVKPRCWHIFYGIDEATVVEYSPQVYESKDAYKIDMGGV
jgi:mannose-6-phosphate isomerase-like protein (cupin superfamily)